jgi:hypothetical protein
MAGVVVVSVQCRGVFKLKVACRTIQLSEDPQQPAVFGSYLSHHAICKHIG